MSYLNIQQIITEADILVPNDVQTADKVVALNGFNQDFFNVVKIPRVISFAPVIDQSDYILSAEVRLKNIDLVSVGVIRYRELLPSTANPLQNTLTFDDSSHVLTLRPAPYASDLQGLIRYARIATTTFTADNLSSAPDAPEEYHWSFIPALASYLANTQDDAIKAANYEVQYKAAWNVAAQAYSEVSAK